MMEVEPSGVTASRSPTPDFQRRKRSVKPRRSGRTREESETEKSDDDRESGAESDDDRDKPAFKPVGDPNTTPQLSVVYAPGGMMPDLEPYIGYLIEIRIPSKHFSTSNKEVQSRQLWGTDTYTDDSDVVCILMHCGHVGLRSNPPLGFVGMSAIFRVLPGQDNYQGSTRYNFISRSWSSQYNKCSLHLEKTSRIEDVHALDVPRPIRTRNRTREDERNRVVGMTLSDSSSSSRSSGKNKRKFVPDTLIVYNASNDPCLKYSLGLVGDRGMDRSEWTSARLKREVMYLETPYVRHELCRESAPSSNKRAKTESSSDEHKSFDTYRWSRVLLTPTLRGSFGSLRPSTRHTERTQAPLPPSDVEVLEDKLDWEEIEWGPSSVRIRNKVYPIQTVQFKAISK